MDKKYIKQLKKEWLKKYNLPIICVAIVVAALFVSYAIFRHFILVLLAIMLGFASFFIFNNKMLSYVEENSFKHK